MGNFFRSIRILHSSLIALAICLSSGCALLLVGAAVGAGTVVYVRGELKSADEVSLSRAWSAAQNAMSELQFKVTSQEKDALAGKIEALRMDSTKVTVRLPILSRKYESESVHSATRLRHGSYSKRSSRVTSAVVTGSRSPHR
jgi:hypothetical protein